MKKWFFLLPCLVFSLCASAQTDEKHFTRAGSYQGSEADFNTDTLTRRSFIGSIGTGTDVLNAPLAGPDNSWWSTINIRHRNGQEDGYLYGTQIAVGLTRHVNRMFFRGQYHGTWDNWKEVFTTATPRVLINNAIDDGSSTLQVNGPIKTNNALISGITGSGSITPQFYLANPTGTRAFNLQLTEGEYPGLGMWRFLNGTWHEAMRVGSDGNVAIGTTDAAGHKLAVAGSIIAEKIKVKAQGNWPDYVFHSGYQLPSLPELESFIATHHHLPDIPSAAEVEKNGHDLGEMNKKLLQKIEELTLYMIDLQKQIKTQQDEILLLKGKH